MEDCGLSGGIVEQRRRYGMPIHAHRLVVEVHIQVSAKHQQKADSIDITEMHAPKHANQRKGQPQQATRNGPTGDRGTLQIARTSGQLQIGRDKQCAAIDQHQHQKDADAVPRVTIAENAQFKHRLPPQHGQPQEHSATRARAISHCVWYCSTTMGVVAFFFNKALYR